MAVNTALPLNVYSQLKYIQMSNSNSSAAIEQNGLLAAVWQPGRKVKITASTSGHEFEIGEIVSIIEWDDDSWKCVNNKGQFWWVSENEGEVIGKTMEEIISPAWSWLSKGKSIYSGRENGDCFKAADVLHALKMVARNCG